MEIKKIEFKSLLVDKGYSIKQFSALVPMDYVYLINIINGKVKPSEIMALKISKSLDVDLHEIFTLHEKK